MNRKLKTILSAMILTGVGLTSMAAASEVRVMGVKNGLIQEKVPMVNTYIPKGYDDNDNIEIIVEGYLPNLCYKTPHAQVEVTGSKINIDLMAWRSADENMMCAEMVVPFIYAVSVGVLDEGNYEVHVNHSRPFALYVEEATSTAIDEEIYANVSTIERVYGERTVLVKGYNPSDCLEFDRFEVVDNKIDTYSVLPIMKQVSEFCPKKMVPFEYELNVPNTLKRDTVLLHVRALNGKSVNSLFNQR